MRSRLFLWVQLAACCNGFCDGYVDFSNSGAFRTPGDRKIYIDYAGGTPLVGTNYAAQLYCGPSFDDLSPVGLPALFRNASSSSPAAGTWTGGTRTLPGTTPGDTVWLQVRIWDIQKYPTWEAATNAGPGNATKCFPFTYTVPIPTGTAGVRMENYHPNDEITRSFFFPPVLMSNEVTITWLPLTQSLVEYSADPKSTKWEALPNTPTNGILRLHPTNSVTIFRLK